MSRPAPRLLAVVFADVSDSTKLYGALGDDEAHRRIDLCLQTLRLVVAECNGRVIKAIGDALLCVFDAADDGISAASAMQSRLEAQRRMDAGMPSIRIGMAYGPVLEIENDVFGDTVNIAARVAALATSGRVFTTQRTVEALSPLLRACCRALYAIEVKGVETKVSIYDVVWKMDAELTLVAGNRNAVLPQPINILSLIYRGQELRISLDKTAVRLGRDPDNDLVVIAKTASRRHARVYLYEGNFVLVDESANGTFVRFEGKTELYLRREETVLVGHGFIGLGQTTLLDGADTVAFAVQ